MESPAWSRIVLDLLLSSIYCRSFSLYQTRRSDGRAACFPNPLTRTFEPLKWASFEINPGTTLSFSVTASSHVGFAWCEPGARLTSSCIVSGDSACHSPDSVSRDTVLRREICLEFPMARKSGPQDIELYVPSHEALTPNLTRTRESRYLHVNVITT